MCARLFEGGSPEANQKFLIKLLEEAGRQHILLAILATAVVTNLRFLDGIFKDQLGEGMLWVAGTAVAGYFGTKIATTFRRGGE